MLRSKTQETIPAPQQKQTKTEDSEFKEAYFFVSNWINYVKFLHRVVKFVSIAAPVDLQDIQRNIVKCMFDEIQQLHTTLDSTDKEPKCEQWKEFMQSQKSQFVRKKLKKYENKYKMFHEASPSASKLDPKHVLDSINKLINHLDM